MKNIDLLLNDSEKSFLAATDTGRSILKKFEVFMEDKKKSKKEFCKCGGKVHPWCLPGFETPNMANRVAMGDIC